jgi:hypothetical protein
VTSPADFVESLSESGNELRNRDAEFYCIFAKGLEATVLQVAYSKFKTTLRPAAAASPAVAGGSSAAAAMASPAPAAVPSVGVGTTPVGECLHGVRAELDNV